MLLLQINYIAMVSKSVVSGTTLTTFYNGCYELIHFGIRIHVSLHCCRLFRIVDALSLKAPGRGGA